MVTQINPFQQQIWRSVDALQVGLGPEAVILEELTRAQERFVATLVSGIADSQVEAIAKQLKFDLATAKDLVAQLEPVCLRQPMPEPTESDFANAELVRATLNSNSDGFALIENRGKKRVYLNQLNRAGASIAQALAVSGIGQLLTSDRSKVTAGDLNHYLKALENCQRTAALSYQLKETGFKTKVSALDSKPFDLAVLVAQQYLPPARYAPLMSRKVPHIAVLFDHSGVTISPLVIPGLTACLFCAEQARVEADAAWPVIASQLSTNQIDFDDTTTRTLAAARVTAVVTAWFDRERGANQGWRFDSPTGELRSFELQPSEHCDCQLALRLEQVQESRALAS